ncbi:TetR/AcrR family transcriptional regulator [Geodermatophilus tzadiensis]|uniref:TetR/AcrR family transcriptional regulator n=1 Tax=Geodermatophilus tzadiensis TaxID=1137988 RepID=UPI000D07F3AF|nr:TetR/AcrR family transcriptional regulator [Geodermatophilus tzadiensis]
MPRRPDPAVRTRLVERAARMLADREPVTLRALVEGTGASTMAVYTHFGGMPGLWSAVRQEGFTRLAARLAAVPRTADPVHDLVALGVAYARNALDAPELYRAMFDARADLADAPAADATFDRLVDAVARARDEGRLAATTDPRALATQYWAAGHGLVSLVVQGVLPADGLAPLATGTAVALLTAAGDDPGRCRASVQRAWAAG